MMASRRKAASKLVTAEELARMPDDGYRYDLIGGVLLKMCPASFEHGWLAAQIAALLWNFVRPRRLGIVVGAETGFLLARDPDHVLGPDVAFVRAERLPPRRERRRYLPLAPDLAVEIVSPSDRTRTVIDKVMEYLDYGVRLVWVVYPVRQMVMVWNGDRTGRLLGEHDELDGGDVLPGFRVRVGDLFEEWDEPAAEPEGGRNGR
jgi:Uma2 family endonuclease